MLTRHSLYLSLFFMPIIFVGIALGVWQYHRADWKAEILSAYHKKLSQPPAKIPTVIMRLKGNMKAAQGEENALLKDYELLPITLKGKFITDLIFYRPNSDGLEVITGFKAKEGIIPVNIGKIPFSTRDLPINEIVPSQENITISGFYRYSEPYDGLLPENKALVNKIPFALFADRYTENILAGAIQMDDKIPLSRYVTGRSAQFFIDNIPNNHIQYMWTWFLLAGIAGIVYVILLKKSFEKS